MEQHDERPPSDIARGQGPQKRVLEENSSTRNDSVRIELTEVEPRSARRRPTEVLTFSDLHGHRGASRGPSPGSRSPLWVAPACGACPRRAGADGLETPKRTQSVVRSGQTL